MTGVDDGVVQQTSVVHFPGLLSDEELEQVRMCQRAQLESGIRPQQHPHKRRTFLSGGGAAGGGLRGLVPSVFAKLSGAVVRAKSLGGWGEQTGGALTDSDFSGLELRVAEFWEYQPGGGLVDDYHYDDGSTATIVCLVNDRSEFTGGVLRTFEPTGTHAEHHMEQGDAVCFLSHKYHNVTPVASGQRQTLVLEFWKAREVTSGTADPRMSSDQDSGFVGCSDLSSAQKAFGNCERRLEFVGVSPSDTLKSCLDFVEELLASDPHCSQPLQGLSFTSCGLGDDELDRLCLMFQHGVGQGLSDVGVSKCLGIASARWAQFWRHLPKAATWLDFGDNQLEDTDVAPLFKQLPCHPLLSKLHLDGNLLSCVSLLCDALRGSQVTELDLGDNRLGDAAASDICSVLPDVPLSTLVLGINPISAFGARELLLKLPRSRLQTLYLDHTGVDDTCLEELSKAIGQSMLEELHLDSTRISDSGVQGLIPTISGTRLAYLDARGNGLSDLTIRALEDVLQDQGSASSASSG